MQDKLHDYLGIFLAVGNAFSDRSSALLTVQTLSSELAALHARIEKLEAASSKIFGGDRSRMRKIEELKESIRVTKEAKTCAEREYEQIKVTSSFLIFAKACEIGSLIFSVVIRIMLRSEYKKINCHVMSLRVNFVHMLTLHCKAQRLERERVS